MGRSLLPRVFGITVILAVAFSSCKWGGVVSVEGVSVDGSDAGEVGSAAVKPILSVLVELEKKARAADSEDRTTTDAVVGTLMGELRVAERVEKDYKKRMQQARAESQLLDGRADTSVHVLGSLTKLKDLADMAQKSLETACEAKRVTIADEAAAVDERRGLLMEIRRTFDSSKTTKFTNDSAAALELAEASLMNSSYKVAAQKYTTPEVCRMVELEGLTEGKIETQIADLERASVEWRAEADVQRRRVIAGQEVLESHTERVEAARKKLVDAADEYQIRRNTRVSKILCPSSKLRVALSFEGQDVPDLGLLPGPAQYPGASVKATTIDDCPESLADIIPDVSLVPRSRPPIEYKGGSGLSDNFATVEQPYKEPGRDVDVHSV